MSNLHKLDQLLKSKLELKAGTTDEQVLAALNEDIGKIRKEISRQQRIEWEEKHERLGWD
jgi:predicted HD phosphohydrolase